jgi:hypothetical protein
MRFDAGIALTDLARWQTVIAGNGVDNGVHRRFAPVLIKRGGAAKNVDLH